MKHLMPLGFLLLFAMIVVVAQTWFEDRQHAIRLSSVKKQYYQHSEKMEYDERMHAIRKLIRLAAELHDEDIPNVDIYTGDRGYEQMGIYTFCYPQDKPELLPYCGPDWCFYWWKSGNILNYMKEVKYLQEVGSEPPLTEKAGWVGNIHSPLRDVPEYKTRPLLYEIAKSNPSSLEVVHVQPMNGEISKNNDNYQSQGSQVKRFKYLIDIGGNGYSGRLKMLMWSQRPILLVDRRYVEYFHKDLVPYKHFVPVHKDLSNLMEQIQWCNQHPQETHAIAQNALRYAQQHFKLEEILRNVHETSKRCVDYKKKQTG